MTTAWLIIYSHGTCLTGAKSRRRGGHHRGEVRGAKEFSLSFTNQRHQTDAERGRQPLPAPVEACGFGVKEPLMGVASKPYL